MICSFISVEHRAPLCQNGRGRGESDNQFPMEIFFIFLFLLYPQGRDTRSGSGKARLWGTLRWFMLTFVLHSFRLPDVTTSGPIELSGSFSVCQSPAPRWGRDLCDPRHSPAASMSVGRGFWDVPVPLRPPCISPTARVPTPGASGPGCAGHRDHQEPPGHFTRHMGEALEEHFPPEVRNNNLYVKCKIWSLSVVGQMMQGQRRHLAASCRTLELSLCAQRGLWHSAGGFLGFFSSFF